MRRLHKLFITLSLIVVLCAGAGSAFANPRVSKERTVNGRITSIDLGSRIMTVRDASTGQEIKMRVPAGMRLRTTHDSYNPVSFEQLLPGMVVRNISVN